MHSSTVSLFQKFASLFFFFRFCPSQEPRRNYKSKCVLIISADCTSIANCFVFLLFSYTLGDLNNTRPAPPSPWKRRGRANSIHLRYLVRLFSVCRKCPNEEESLSSTEASALHPNKKGKQSKNNNCAGATQKGLKQRRRGRQRERQNDNFARASRFFVHFYTVTL